MEAGDHYHRGSGFQMGVGMMGQGAIAWDDCPVKREQAMKIQPHPVLNFQRRH